MADKFHQLTSPNQTDSTSPYAALQGMLDRQKYTTDGMLPAQVVSYDRVKNIATIKPMIHFVGLDDNAIERMPLVDINVLALGGGGFVVNFPLVAGDLGWILAGDRELSTFLENLSEAAPSHGRSKSFADGLFIPDVFRKYTLNGADTSSMVIQSTDGSVRIALSGDSVNITSTVGVNINSPMTTIEQNLTVKGMSNFKGGISADTGTTVTLPANSTIGGINVTTHGHTQQNNGSGRTSGGMTS